MKTWMLLFSLIFAGISFGQIEIWPEDSLKDYEGKVITVYTKEYLNAYNRMKRIIVKVYPYALHAANVVDEIDQKAEEIERRRKKNKFFKQSYHGLRDDFKYFILDLYTSEGIMLMKLIHRETGMTVYDISSKYRGKQKANMFNLMARIWDQNLHVVFDPSDRNDKIAEQVILDIQEGLIPFNDEVITIDKLTYRDQLKRDKAKAKANRKRNKEYAKNQKKRLKAQKKQKRKDKRKG